MISEQYQKDLQKYRETNENWGSTGARNFGARLLAFLDERIGIYTILDFGCGTGSLRKYIEGNSDHPIGWTEYDPGVVGKESLPEGTFDLIVSIDVLEHIEPDQLTDVLDWMTRHSRAQYHYIACSPDKGPPLPDGSNAHKIVQLPIWWRHQFSDRGTVMFWSHEEKRKTGVIAPYCAIQVDGCKSDTDK